MLQGSPGRAATPALRRLAVALTVVLTVLAGWFVPATDAQAAAPKATLLSPAGVSTAGGTRITITGKNLTKVKAVYLGSTKVKKVTHVSKSKIRITAPSHAAGTVKVTLLVGKKKYSTSLRLTYVSNTPGANSFEAEVFRLTNNARGAARACGSTRMPKVPALAWSATLGGTARAHSADMAANKYFAHASQDGTSFSDRISQAGYRWTSVAENIAAGQQTPAAVVSAWLNSPGHCRNIMSSQVTQLGVGYAAGGTYGSYWTQDFGKPAA
jgi:uncharacterized protein YkwD